MQTDDLFITIHIYKIASKLKGILYFEILTAIKKWRSNKEDYCTKMIWVNRLTKLKITLLKFDVMPSIFLKAVFHKIYMVHFFIFYYVLIQNEDN